MATTGVKEVTAYLNAKQHEEKDKDLAIEWAELEELYNRKLWHQLTLKVGTMVKHPSLQKKDNLIQLYTNFIQSFENKINPLSLVEILAHVVVQFADHREAIAFLEKSEVKVKANDEAVALCKVLAGQIMLSKLNDQEGTKKVIEDVEKIFGDKDGITTVHGRYYLLASQYYRLQGKHAEYYHTALRYLGCVELSDIGHEEQMQHAFFLSLAALLGEGVYNLGELLAHPVLETLKGTDNVWVVELLGAFNSGDISKFDAMKPKWSTIPDLLAQELKLRQKISLLCLMEMTFKRSAINRQLTFQEISAEAHLPLDEVELLVMKALAQGLVKGGIDEKANTVHLTWVQPRVLDTTQISSMLQRLNTWCSDVISIQSLLETRAHEFLVL